MRTTDSELKALMLASLAGDAAAYRLLLESLERQLLAFFRRRLAVDATEAPDLVQETLIAIHGRRGTYDASQSFAAWAYGIARHKLLDHFRRRGRAAIIPLNESDALLAADESASADARHDIEKALASLPPATQALVRDVKLHDLSHAEAGARRGMSETATKVAVHRAMKRLAAFLHAQKDPRP